MTVTNERLNGKRTNPFPMQDPLFVPRERYYDREFFELEKEHLWRHTWQMACRLEEIPEVGDFTEYVICDQSIIVVREREDRIRAFYNACRHRATELLKGSGSLLGGQIVCPFHGWRWNSDGSSSFVYGAEAFAAECLKPDDIKLQECLSDVWGGCVWINLDPEAAPLQEMLAPAAAILDPLGLADMKVWWWKEIVLDVNWKMAMEAFLEGYHTMRTHTQLTMGAGEDWPAGSILYDTFEHGHSRFWMKPSDEPMSVEMFIEFARVLWEGQDAMTLERDVRRLRGTPQPSGRTGKRSSGRHRRALRVLRRSRYPVTPTHTRTDGTVGRRGVPVPELLRAAAIRQRAELSLPSLRGRPREVPLRGLVAHALPGRSRTPVGRLSRAASPKMTTRTGA